MFFVDDEKVEFFVGNEIVHFVRFIVLADMDVERGAGIRSISPS